MMRTPEGPRKRKRCGDDSSHGHHLAKICP
jgi:hypothetical protein